MKMIALASAILAACAMPAHAEEAKPESEVSFNAAVTSDYRYRGISQTRLNPALQGGADYVNHPAGLYVGAWVSSIKWTKDAGGGGGVELDIYGGKRGQVSSDISYDVGVLAYVYGGNDLKHVLGFANADTTELYGQLGYGQKVKHNGAADYTDWKVGVTKDLGFASVQLAAVGTNAGKSAYASPANGKFLGKHACS